MSKFVRSDDGAWLNLNFIAKIVPIGGDQAGHEFIDAEGHVIGTSIGFDPSYATLEDPVIPALPGEALFEFYALSTENQPESVADIITVERPILAWRCGRLRPTPVTYRPWFDRGASMYLYRWADGRFADEWDARAVLENLEAAKAYALRKIRSQWN